MTKIEFDHIAYLDIPGGGQVTVKDGLCFVGHIDPPHGTTIVDVADPCAPRVIARLEAPADTRTHKVRVSNGTMLINNEALSSKQPAEFFPGLRIFDITRPSNPREIGCFRTGGRGMHRFDFDGRYAYLSTEMEGYRGNIVLIIDLHDPSRPQEVSRWWLPGQWVAGGEDPTLHKGHRVHHPLRFGNRLYVSCCNAGMALVDVSDLCHPRTIVRHPLHGLFTHTVMPYQDSAGDDFVVAVDEGWWKLEGGVTVLSLDQSLAASIVAAHNMAPGEGKRIWAAHQPFERMIGDRLFVAWFGHGLRVLDMSKPAVPIEVGNFLPKERGEFGVMSNDVFVDPAQRRAYLLDRARGLDILEFRT